MYWKEEQNLPSSIMFLASRGSLGSSKTYECARCNAISKFLKSERNGKVKLRENGR